MRANFENAAQQLNSWVEKHKGIIVAVIFILLFIALILFTLKTYLWLTTDYARFASDPYNYCCDYCFDILNQTSMAFKKP